LKICILNILISIVTKLFQILKRLPQDFSDNIAKLTIMTKLKRKIALSFYTQGGMLKIMTLHLFSRDNRSTLNARINNIIIGLIVCR